MPLNPDKIWKGMEEEIRTCKKCILGQHREEMKYLAVPGDGPYQTSILFVGEAPGEDEALQGLPFVGRAGQLLTELLSRVNIPRQRVYITNVLKCRPPDNRDPKPEEISACLPYLFAQIHLLQPQLICILGRVALEGFLGPKVSFKEFRGKLFSRWGMNFFCTYHPAAVLHNPQWKQTLVKDFFALRRYLQSFSPDFFTSVKQ